MVKAAWWQFYDAVPSAFDRVIQSWDTASKNTEFSDYSVCTTWGMMERKLYLLDVFREKLNYPDLKRAVKKQAELFKPAIVLVEDKASGIALLQDLPSEGVRGLQGCKPEGDKAMRLYTHLSWIEGGNVLLPKASPWLASYRRELEVFPHAGNDDQVDSTSQVLEWVQQFDPGEHRFLIVPRPNQLDLRGFMGAFEGHAPTWR